MPEINEFGQQVKDRVPVRDAALQAWLAPENFDAEGRQIKRLETFR